ncbi:unnamed protein product [Caenorhabditis angaria]|uniref:G-protein coupled receptors family 1 profile domain-containing protein n=1 Tax=Caenorhabditis angaria TaxID=860376 RepID=A0A9P1IAJ3_9PELO|nr:unnamed protein product [Caenorhabditis angaria]
MCEDDEPKSIVSFSLVIAGSIISIVSIFNNVLLFIALLRNNRCFKCYFHFILALCFFDIIVSVCYMPVILVDSLKDWTKWVELARAWWPFFVYGLTLTNVSMTTASFILVAILYERYLITVRSYILKQFQTKRSLWCFLCLLLGILTKGGMFLELDVFPNEDETCKNTVLEYEVGMTEISQSLWYGNVYKFWIRNIVTVFLPFFLLLTINLQIVLELRKRMNRELSIGSRQRFSSKMQSKTNVKQATATMLFICVIYLICNATNVFITAWEFIDIKSLQDEFIIPYMLSADISSVLVVTACALRLPIYMLCNPELRRTIKRSFTHRIEHQQKLQDTFSLITKILV